jgi:glutaredoxin
MISDRESKLDVMRGLRREDPSGDWVKQAKMATLFRPCLLALGLASIPALVAGCKRPPPPSDEDSVSSVDAGPPVVKDSSEGLLFTWIDEKGQFHVQEKPTDIPIVGRDAVRVVDPRTYDGSNPTKIFVVDLRVAQPDGAYPVRVSTRAEFDALAEARRVKNGPTLASAAHSATPEQGPAGAGSSAPLAQGTDTQQPGASRPAVILYGASWCGACHEAAAYLKRKGVAFIEKDIEEDANAAREMQAKLAHAGKRSGSIPVLDVRGKVMVGFNPREVDSALGEAL